MARKANTHAPEEIAASVPILNSRELARTDETMREMDAHRIEVATQFGTGIAYNLSLYEQVIRSKVNAVSVDLLEIGLLLCQIKEIEPQGEFHASLERMRISPRFAQKNMQAARKFGTSQHTKTMADRLGFAKVLELLTEDNDDLDALASGGTLAGHTLDELDTMTVRELKQALRNERQEAAASEELLRKKDERINKLVRDKKRVNQSASRVQVDDLLAELDVAAVEAGSVILRIRDLVNAISQVYDEHGEAMDEDVGRRIDENQQHVLVSVQQLDS